MKRDVGDKLSEASKDGMIMPALSDMPDYDYGLCGSFNKESLAKLDLDDEVKAGDYLHISGFARVTGVKMKPGSDEVDCVEWCLCHLAVEDEDEENEEDGAY